MHSDATFDLAVRAVTERLAEDVVVELWLLAHSGALYN